MEDWLKHQISPSLHIVKLHQTIHYLFPKNKQLILSCFYARVHFGVYFDNDQALC